MTGSARLVGSARQSSCSARLERVSLSDCITCFCARRVLRLGITVVCCCVAAVVCVAVAELCVRGVPHDSLGASSTAGRIVLIMISELNQKK